MGFMDKLKNIFFEEDDEEEIEEPVSPKKEKVKEKELKIEKEEKKEKLKDVIARKVELPKSDKKDQKEKNEFDEIEIPSSAVEISKKEPLELSKVVEKEVVEKPKEEIKLKKEPKINQELIFDDEDFILDTKPKVKREQAIINKVKQEETNLYRGKDIKKEIRNDYPKTGYANKKEEPKLKTFTPSPIISPIYGILDKNYKKEEVKENKEIRISSRPSRMDLDSVRNKAFGDLEYDLNLIDDTKKEEIKENKKEEKKLKEDLKKIYNRKSVDDDKPSIERVTIGEADEYYNDLGLAYNTDYKDLSKDLSDGKIVEKSDEKKDNLEDNLFDLIESMYDKDRDL